VTLETKGEITAETTQLLVDSSALMGKAGELSKYQNYSLYVRTAPRASEAIEWFDDNAYTFISYVGSSGTQTDQRGQNYGRPIRWLLEKRVRRVNHRCGLDRGGGYQRQWLDDRPSWPVVPDIK
jgi:hypothetical protein